MNIFKKNSPKFKGVKEEDIKIKSQPEIVISRRFKILIGAVILIGVLLLVRMYYLQVNQQEYYTTKLSQYNTSTFTKDTTRGNGNIYDRNYTRLVYNKTINCATYYTVNGITSGEIEIIVNFLIENVDVDISSVTTRDKKDYLIMKDPDYVNSLLTDEELSGDDDTIYKLKLERITDEILEEHLSDDDIRYYMLYNKIETCTSGSVVLLEDLSVKEASVIGENGDILRGVQITTDWSREYTYGSTFKSVLGSVTTKKQGLPASTQDKLLALDYNNDSRVGTSGLEEQYESILSGTPSTYTLTYDSDGNPSIEVVSSGSSGSNIRLTIDWELQTYISDLIEEVMESTSSWTENDEIFVCMMDPNTGEIYLMAGKQRQDDGTIIDYASGNYLSAYAIGSAFKGATIYTAYKENLITTSTTFNDTSAGFKIAGTETKYSSRAWGTLNDIQALSKSSNVFMWNIAVLLGGGTYTYGCTLDIDESAFDILRRDAGDLGLGVKTGLDVPYEELGYRGKITSRLAGNLLDAVIGQYDTYTTIQMVQYVSTIANGGKRIQPHLFKETFEETSDGTKIAKLQHKVKVLDDVTSYSLGITRVQLGFRQSCIDGLAVSYNNNGYAEVAGKTGTAQVYVGGVEHDNKTFVGYAPYDDPQIAIACISAQQPKDSSSSCLTLVNAAFEKYFELYGTDDE
ncbi:MAG: penicillin-binding protein 2 [Erysipelotrichaceae bacterium]|nr:penicillin-binding protein 2 [Erysipelotrichaceae bacterium]